MGSSRQTSVESTLSEYIDPPEVSGDEARRLRKRLVQSRMRPYNKTVDCGSRVAEL
jgi:hypothetical protein